MRNQHSDLYQSPKNNKASSIQGWLCETNLMMTF